MFLDCIMCNGWNEIDGFMHHFSNGSCMAKCAWILCFLQSKVNCLKSQCIVCFISNLFSTHLSWLSLAIEFFFSEAFVTLLPPQYDAFLIIYVAYKKINIKPNAMCVFFSVSIVVKLLLLWCCAAKHMKICQTLVQIWDNLFFCVS